MDKAALRELAEDIVPLWDNGSFEREDAEQAKAAILALLAEIQSLTEERTAWRTTAENAEAELKAIKEAKPVAWEVYVAEADHGYLVDSLDDPQLIDDCTNHDAVVTPLYTLEGKS